MTDTHAQTMLMQNWLTNCVRKGYTRQQVCEQYEVP